ncbi:MAG: UMP kinase [Patescibacteria group bacterium]
MSKTYVLSVGGSLIAPAVGIDLKFLKSFRAFIIRRIKQGDKFYLVIGGGTTARNYIAAANKLAIKSQMERDWVGIAATRLNARLVQAMFGSIAYSEIISDPTQKIKTSKKIVIAAGYKPGWSTDYVAVLIARNNSADLVVNMSNIEYVYDRDPRKFPLAKKITDISWAEFRKIVGNKWRPGANLPFDPIASREAAKNKLKVVILNGNNLANLEDCLNGKKFRGTKIA